MRLLSIIFMWIFAVGCGPFNCENKSDASLDEIKASEIAISQMLDDYHKAAAEANFEKYFNHFDEESIFTGTDATERWDKKSFMEWSKPYFDKGKAWNFTSIERHIFLNKDGQTAWFDELLNTQMKICRGSGVVAKTENGWKIKQYILSMTIPNDQLENVLPLKAAQEDSILKSF